MTPLSTDAIGTLKALYGEPLSRLYLLEVVDIHQQPPEVLDQQINAAPPLARRSPLPHRRMVGKLPELERLMQGLEVR